MSRLKQRGRPHERYCVSTPLSEGQKSGCRRSSSQCAPAFHGPRFRESNEPKQTLGSTLLSGSLGRSGSTSLTYLNRGVTKSPTNPNSLLAETMRTSSTPELSLMPSRRQTENRSNDTATREGPEWRVKLHREVAKTIARYGGINSELLRPTFGDLILALEIDPKQFPKKHGKLGNARAVEIRFNDGVEWRAVYVL